MPRACRCCIVAPAALGPNESSYCSCRIRRGIWPLGSGGEGCNGSTVPPAWRWNGGRATKESIFKHAETAHVTHYTGHSYFHPKEPLQSALILEGLSEQASSRWLRLRDAFTRLDLRRNRLAILNGCESGVLFPDPVDEYVNLPTGFLYAGAACVISTLWPVWDLSSALLMVRFHQIWKEDGRSDRIATALRQAQAWLRREIRSGPQLRDEVLPAFLKSVEDEDLRRKCVAAADEYARRFPDRPPFAHPIYWAPFICSGLGYPLARP